ncbi:MAG: N-acetylmuramoyl-L-alanine amidase [Treponema sp.]|jgi:N-acetylmuramoyl-L-alanine amidase|nr:N-acetylmuramoyl-L-alanine amidase [Treponema sp.]
MKTFGRFYLFLLLLFIRPALDLSAQTPAPAPAEPGKTGGKPLSLDEALAGLGSLTGEKKQSAEFRWDPFFQKGVFSLAGHYAAFQTGKAGDTGLLMIDGREIFTLPLPYLEGGNIFFPEAFLAAAKNAFSRALEDESSRFRIAAIIVDPGHGGKDSGAVGTFTVRGKPLQSVEKDITLKVSKDLHALLSTAYPDKRVLLTRTGDTYPTLENRVAIANSVPLRENEAIVFISIHANASFNKQARGYEVWYLSPDYRRNVLDRSKVTDSAEVIPILNAMLEEEFTTESILMAQSILRRFEEALGEAIPSRGIKAEEWFVVRNARMPSVLVELGFVTNEADALLMADESHLKKVSEALYKGIADFVTTFERSGGFTAIP